MGHKPWCLESKSLDIKEEKKATRIGYTHRTLNHVILQLQNCGAITMLRSTDGTEGVEFRLEEGNVLMLFPNTYRSLIETEKQKKFMEKNFSFSVHVFLHSCPLDTWRIITLVTF